MRLDSPADYRSYGSALVDRLFGDGALVDPIPAALKPHAKAFQAEHAAWRSADDAATKAADARNEAVRALADGDTALDQRVLGLADEVVVAKLGSRLAPFKDFSRNSPSAIVALSHKRELDEVRAVLRKLQKKSGTPALKKGIDATSKAADVVEKSLKKLGAAQTAYDRALSKRDAQIPDWTKAHATLKKWGAAVWSDDPSTFEAVFAPPTAEERPVRKTKTKKPAPSPAPAT